MYIAYADESGDDGAKGSMSYALGCVMVEGAEWQHTFDGMIAFRRWVRASFGVPMRAELKASFLLRNGGPWLSRHPLPSGMRHTIYRSHMRIQPKLGMTAFAVVVDKQKAISKFGAARATSDIAWSTCCNGLSAAPRKKARRSSWSMRFAGRPHARTAGTPSGHRGKLFRHRQPLGSVHAAA